MLAGRDNQHRTFQVLRQDQFTASCASWNDFWERVKRLPTDREKGTTFERLTQLYLQITPEYQTELRDVWRLPEVPSDVRRRLNLPARDEGIDLIACTRHGKFWAIQSKFFCCCCTASKPVSKHHLMRNTAEIGLDRRQSLDQESWCLIVAKLGGRSARPDARSPRAHQRTAISAAEAYFVRDGAARGRLIMPCGTGKSLTTCLF
jgi:predicted helicase